MNDPDLGGGWKILLHRSKDFLSFASFPLQVLRTKTSFDFISTEHILPPGKEARLVPQNPVRANITFIILSEIPPRGFPEHPVSLRMPNWFMTISASCCLLDQMGSFPHDISCKLRLSRVPRHLSVKKPLFYRQQPFCEQKKKKRLPRVQTTPEDWWEGTWLLVRYDVTNS